MRRQRPLLAIATAFAGNLFPGVWGFHSQSIECIREGMTARQATVDDILIPSDEVLSNKVRIAKPLGIVLEEDSDKYDGIVVAEIVSEGNAARTRILCQGDRIMAVNEIDTSSANLEMVLNLIHSTAASTDNDGEYVEITTHRPKESVVVEFPHGARVAALPGEYLGNVADRAQYPIPYECRSGSCGTCAQSCVVVTDAAAAAAAAIDADQRDDGGNTRRRSSKQRVVRPCVAKIPKSGVAEIRVESGNERYDGKQP